MRELSLIIIIIIIIHFVERHSAVASEALAEQVSTIEEDGTLSDKLKMANRQLTTHVARQTGTGR